MAAALALPVLFLLALAAPPAGAQQPLGPGTAWVVVDADTGAVLEGVNARTPLPPASLTKVLTALAVVRAVGPGATVPVSPRAAAMPASRVGMQAGQMWDLDHAMHSLMLTSSNDAAMALAERTSKEAESFSAAMHATAVHLGMRDGPVLRDPAGLDGPQGMAGGNLVSATDLAIAARAALSEPRITSVWGTKDYRFAAPDGFPRLLVNHNKLLWSYPGTAGGKTGYTRRAGHCFMAVASRDGRTIIVVLLNVTDHYGMARALLDRGFATPSPAAPGDQLPRVPLLAVSATAGLLEPPTVAVATALPPSPRLQPALAGLSLFCALAALPFLYAKRHRRDAGMGAGKLV